MPGSGVRVTSPNDEFVDGPSWLTPGMKMLPVAAGFSQFRVSVESSIGLYACGNVTVEKAESYLLMLAFTAVLPVPNRSYDAPNRGAQFVNVGIVCPGKSGRGAYPSATISACCCTETPSSG